MEAEIPAYAAPRDDYTDWFRGFVNDWLRLSGRVQEDAYMPEVPEEEPAEVPFQPHEQPNFQPYEAQYQGFQPNFQPFPPQGAQFGTADDMQQFKWMESFLLRTTPPEPSRASINCVPRVRLTVDSWTSVGVIPATYPHLAPAWSSADSWSSAGVISGPPEICNHPVDLNTHQIPLDPIDAADEAQSNPRDEGSSGSGPSVEQRYNLRDKDNRKAPKKYSPSPFQKVKNFVTGKKK
ncbi:hypothetical protein PIB30_020741 [Stylosanthes scabra]|uniref:Uncharacterized protein n=1 Tax=Stylosanthes scabra TaxID=79078 RepID=A0ABU6Z692_9FABA|nr:hypothetical protein [Stylosanthes scabra]